VYEALAAASGRTSAPAVGKTEILNPTAQEVFPPTFYSAKPPHGSKRGVSVFHACESISPACATIFIN
jgi:hypothetical protein